MANGEQVATYLVEVIQGRYYQQDGTWYEQAGEDSFTHHKLCSCGVELTKVRGVWQSCPFPQDHEE